jgi:hypothetical protein
MGQGPDRWARGRQVGQERLLIIIQIKEIPKGKGNFRKNPF